MYVLENILLFLNKSNKQHRHFELNIMTEKLLNICSL